MGTYGIETAQDTVQIERLLPGPVERVWSYLVDSDKRGQWFASGVMEPRGGATVKLEFDNSSLTPHGETTPEEFACGDGFTSTITQWDPPRALAYTFGGLDAESHVLFELQPHGEQVLLTLTHSRLQTRNDKIMVSSGWHVHLDVLSAKLEGRIPEPFWSTWYQKRDEYDAKLSQ